MSNTVSSTKVTEEQLAALQKAYINADNATMNARVWASPEYVAKQAKFADRAWMAYREALDSLQN